MFVVVHLMYNLLMCGDIFLLELISICLSVFLSTILLDLWQYNLEFENCQTLVMHRFHSYRSI